jgi:hypothetical protein
MPGMRVEEGPGNRVQLPFPVMRIGKLTIDWKIFSNFINSEPYQRNFIFYLYL